jgi:hypothetical protein
MKNNYEKVIIIVVLVALLGSALYLVLKIGHMRKGLIEKNWEHSDIEPKVVQPVDLAAWQAGMAMMTNPVKSQVFSNQMMVSELRVQCIDPECAKPIPYRAEVCPFCNKRQPKIQDPKKIDRDGDGIPDPYEKDHGMNAFDPEDAYLDGDSDGFINLEEYQWGTNPNDPADYPSPAAKLRLVKARATPFKLRFQGVQQLSGDKQVFLLNMRSLSKSHFVKMGETVEGYKVINYEPKTVERGGKKLDLSVLTLDKDGKQIQLVKNKPVTRQEWEAAIIFLIDGTRYHVRIEDDIDLMGHSYKVIDIKPVGVLIRDKETQKDTEVGRLSDSERARLLDSRNRSEETGPNMTSPVGNAQDKEMPGL